MCIIFHHTNVNFLDPALIQAPALIRENTVIQFFMQIQPTLILKYNVHGFIQIVRNSRHSLPMTRVIGHVLRNESGVYLEFFLMVCL